MPQLYYTVGLSGSGKTTWCKEQFFKNDVLIDSDSVREQLWGNANNQQNPEKVFNTMFKQTVKALEEGKNVYYCATNLVMRRRITFLEQLQKKIPSVITNCVIFSTPVSICKENNSKRARQVPNYVIDKQLRQFEIPVANEGWHNVIVISLFEKESIEKYARKIINFGSQKNSHHNYSLLEHSCLTANAFVNNNFDMFLAAMYHDIGKIYTQTFWEKDNYKEAHYPNHANVGAYLLLGCNLNINVIRLVNYHMLPFGDQKMQATWEKRLGHELWNNILLLHEADKRSAI